MTGSLTLEPFRVAIDDAVLDDLHERLVRARLSAAIPDAGWDYGTDRAYLDELVAYWRDEYDWRRAEARLNEHEQFLTEIDGAQVHALHARSPEPDALPLVLVHGWPGSIVEFLDIVGPLSDPRAHGGDPADAFHVVCPSIPGYGFSGPTRDRGWDPRRVARAFAELMAALGYDRYAAQGGDWGSAIATQLALHDASHMVGVHLNLLLVPLPRDLDREHLSDAERAALDGACAVPRRRLRLLQDPGHQAADDRLRARRLAGRARRVDHREVPDVERLRRRHRTQLHEGPAPRQRDALLAHRHRPLGGPPLLRGPDGRAGASRRASGSRSRPGSRPSRGRSWARPGPGRSPTTTSCTGRRCPEVGILPQWKRASSWWPTSGSASGRCGVRSRDGRTHPE